MSGFEARVDDQYGKQRAPLSKSEIEDIGVKVLKALLACDDATTLTTSDGRTWNAGGLAAILVTLWETLFIIIMITESD